MRFGLSEETIASIEQVFRTHAEVEQAIIYGSRAKESYKPASDIDITLKGDDLSSTIIGQITWELDDLLLPYTFDISIYDQITNETLKMHIANEGAILYSKK
jgi:predicted nucleotidyltransferase